MSDNENVSGVLLPLGRQTDYPRHYDPALLFPVLRQGKRLELGIGSGTRLPFAGWDVWNAYELSWLDSKGKPVVALGELRFPADTPALIESKSLKLYFNSLNQTRFENVAALQARVAADLSLAAGGSVEVCIQPLSAQPMPVVAYPEGILLDELEIECDTYDLNPAFLACDVGAVREEVLYSHLLKSNCLVTGQPDWAMVVIRYRGLPINQAGLLRYLISFRNHNEFHEQCVERIFMDIQRACQPQALAVEARYTRRGGLDINPFRTTGAWPMPANVREVRQ